MLKEYLKKLISTFGIVVSLKHPHALGKLGEIEARTYLAKRGLKILGSNIRLGRFEIDIVAKDGDEIVFVEVKTRKNNFWRYPEDDVGWYKKKTLKKAGKMYLEKFYPDIPYFRFDIVAVTWEPKVDIHWIKNAF